MLIYTTEVIASPDGIACAVLDAAKIDFNGAARGRKTAETLVRKAQGGERIETKNKTGQVESVYVAEAGDAIFINCDNPNDRYVPDAGGTRWQFAEVANKGYKIISGDIAGDEISVESTEFADLLPEAVQMPTCIKDVWAPGEHQFLFEGATLKRNARGIVTGIDKSAFDATWEITRGASGPR